MIEWKTYRLGDVIDKVIDNRGKSAPTSDKKYSPIIEINSIGDRNPNYDVVRKWVSKDTYDTWFRSGHPIIGDILIPTVGTIGVVSMMRENKGCIAQNIVALRTNEKAHNLYLYYFLRSEYVKQELLNLNIGGVQPSIKVPHLLNLEISLPSLEEQRRIAGILGAIDDKIENNRRINTNLESQAQALYKRWFVDFEFPNEEGKPYKSSGGKMIDSELGLIPEGWRVIGYCDVVDIKGGGTPPTTNPEFWSGSIPFFTPKDVSSDCFVLKTEKSITEAGLSNCNSRLYAKNTVFITARGTVGKVVMAGCSMAMNQTNYALIGKNGISQYFVYLSTIQLVDMLLKKANGAVFNAITTKDFEGEKIIYPNDNVLNSFVEIVSSIYEQILTSIIENERLATLRDTLLPKLMNGEIKL